MASPYQQSEPSSQAGSPRSGPVSLTPFPSLITEDHIRDELTRLFDAGPEAGLVIRVYGENSLAGSAEAVATFRELFASLRMYDTSPKERGEILVDAPSKSTLTSALSVLGREEQQKRILDYILTTFGRRLIDPLAEILDTTPSGTLVSRLRVTRDLMLAHITDLRMTAESQALISDDLHKLLTDEYLSMLAEHEERVQRPRVAQLAQQILRLIGSTFHRALRRWPAHAEPIAASIARRHQGQVPLREIPVLLRNHITTGIEEFLWIETSAEIEGALRHLLAEHKGVMPINTAINLDRSTYREFADACWAIIKENC
ncbi:uncharacterized protein CMC5_066350 [Chondromyces crocatus]|uniref:Uncharacterized protein n=1 Tax=Chondromyces crocatus TaxID=52 RepID=A0A0K1ENJ5_CHOCO|nr:uncharacterized protein CMC5_066350 [Chondromyces crocatus]